MATSDPIERVRQAAADAAERGGRWAASPATPNAAPTPGDLYVFGLPVGGAVEWLVVRPHVDDPSLLLLAPADDFFLAGPTDVVLPEEQVGRPLTVRCGEALWLPAACCPTRLRVDRVPAAAVSAVRQTLAALARGTLATGDAPTAAEADPEYSAWMAEIARGRAALESRDWEHQRPVGDVLPFERFAAAPAGAFALPPPVLAASPGGSLLDALAAEVQEGGPRFQEFPLGDGGRLLLVADAAGVRVAWQGPPGLDPPALAAVPGAATWEPGAECWYAPQVFPWVDGLVTLLVGDQKHTLTVQL